MMVITPFCKRVGLNCGAMAELPSLHGVGTTILALLLAAGTVCGAQEDNRKALPIQQPAADQSGIHRLILKDGSYQVVRQYEVVGDRVRYLSQERGEWEELPAELIDWEATRKWERDHANPQPNEASPAMKEAAELDKEEAEVRADQRARMPEVAKGLELPDQSGVFVLDTFEGSPELVELKPVDLNMNQKTRKGLGTFNPLAADKADLELDGAHAHVHLHVNDPAIYLSLDDSDEKPMTTHAFTVDTGGSKDVKNRKHGAHSSGSGFAIVRVDVRKAVRIVGAIEISRTGTVTQSEDVIPTKAETIEGKHWLKLTPAQPLTIGEYALVEILSPSDVSQTVWDFRVDPRMGDNPSSLGPILNPQPR